MLAILWALGPSMLVGSGLTLASVWVGWSVGRHASLLPVRLIRSWVRHVVVPLVTSESWCRRAAAIFINNATICAVVVAAGAWAITGWLAVIALGLGLGAGLRALGEPSSGLTFDAHAEMNRRLAVGFTLNMLEPPAIVVAVGLSLGQRAMAIGLPWDRVWETFAVCVVPLLLAAAAGEALWLEAARRAKST